MILLHPGSVLISVTPMTIKDHADASCLGFHLGPCCYPRAMLLWEPCQFRWPVLPLGTMITPGTRLLSRTMTGPVVLPHPGSVLMFMAHVATKGHIDAWDLGCNLCYEGVLGPCCHQGHPDLSGLCCHLGPWYCPSQGCCRGPCLGL